MGQQQLLLVILVTIIVGIATVVAINTFGSAADSANLDAVRQDIAQIAAGAQAYYISPAQLGGGGRSFVGVTFQGIAFPADSVITNNTVAINANGRYTISDDVIGSFTITAVPSSTVNFNGGSGGVDTFEAEVTPNNLVITNL